MRYFVVVVTFLALLLVGCSSARDEAGTGVTSNTKLLVADEQRIEAIGFLKTEKDPQTLGNLYFGTYYFLPNKESWGWLKHSAEIQPSSEVEKGESEYITIVITEKTGNTLNLSYVTDENLLYNYAAQQYFTAPKEVNDLITTTITNPKYATSRSLVYSGIPYFLLSSTEMINKEELEEIGVVEGVTYYSRKVEEEPKTHIYYLHEKNSYGAFQRISK